MTYYILIRGALGVGKSTIAQRLAKALHAEYISIDALLEKLGLDKATHYEETIPAKNFIKADEFIMPDVKEKINTGKIVIFDGCFQHKEQIEHLIQNLSVPHYIFTLKAPLEICIERDGKRKNTYGKDAAIAVYTVVSRFDYGTVIDTTNKSIGKTVKEILSHLPK
ncbi:MAG: AAA family ATPase [Candidatus Aenigmarchaeota archaeon]|nr:AAA family ATPase [Candidatus Aenigmarchaeota archaeon]